MENVENNNVDSQLRLDYTIQSPQERTALVRKIVDATPPEKLSNRYLQMMANYIIFAMDKQEKKNRLINTDNRLVTINKRQTSFEKLASKFENGEDGIYNMVIDNDKNVLLSPKVSITDKDIAEIGPLRDLRQAIQEVEAREKRATGRKKFLLKKQLIQMRQDQYVIKNSYRQPMYLSNIIKSINNISFEDKIKILEDGSIENKSLISFMNPKHISALLCNYSKLKEDCYGRFGSDGYYLMEDLDKLVDNTLKDKHPLLYKLMIYKIDGEQNTTIQNLLEDQFGVRHSIEYISSLWRKKIPKLIAEEAEREYLDWFYLTKEKGKWKECSKCGQIKLAHNKFFSKNNSSKDGFYSICKDCRNKKTPSKQKIVKRISYKKGSD